MDEPIGDDLAFEQNMPSHYNGTPKKHSHSNQHSANSQGGLSDRPNGSRSGGTTSAKGIVPAGGSSNNLGLPSSTFNLPPAQSSSDMMLGIANANRESSFKRMVKRNQ